MKLLEFRSEAMPNRLYKLLCETMKILRGVLINASIDEKGDFAFISAASTSMDTSVTFEQFTTRTIHQDQRLQWFKHYSTSALYDSDANSNSSDKWQWHTINITQNQDTKRSCDLIGIYSTRSSDTISATIHRSSKSQLLKCSNDIVRHKLRCGSYN